MSGHARGPGRSRTMAQAVIPIGIAHHAMAATVAGRTANGTNSHSPTGG